MKNYESMAPNIIRELIRKQEITGPTAGMSKGFTQANLVILKKEHAFDLGSKKQKIIVECKSHRWTSGDNVPSAKMTVWNEAMYYFSMAPKEYRKIMFVLKDMSKKRKQTIAEYYLHTYNHLVPNDVEFWEYDEATKKAKELSF